MIEIGSVASAQTNLVTGQSSAAAATPDVTMSFGDVLDMLNPLQHIPVVSAVYRAATGETINPVSRIAGDSLYGGVLGVASAVLSTFIAMGDEAIGALNKEPSASSMLASAVGIGGADKTDSSATQGAEKSSTSTGQSSPLPPAQSSPESPPSTANPAAALASAAPLTPPFTTDPSRQTGLPLDRSQAALRGDNDSALMARAQQTQALALALVGGTQALQAQHALRNSRFAVAQSQTTDAPTPLTPLITPYQATAESGSTVDVTH